MTFLLFMAVIALAVAVFRLRARLASLERLVLDFEGKRVATPHSAVSPEPDLEVAITEPQPEVAAGSRTEVTAAALAPAPIPTITAPEIEPVQPDIAPDAEVRPPLPARASISFEALAGGKLPIWIGGAALVLAGFFLVRYSIENGLLGPVARTVIAGLFALALIAASEAARRLTQIRDDPRIGQALAGAGVASLYGTLYVAAEVYHLIGAGTAFLAVVTVTLVGLGLALRHGPPTAIMALIGGFAAPLISGFDASNIGPLLVYLGLLVAALFGLAIRRGWAWLALAACGGGFLWINLLIVMAQRHALAGAGGFVLLLAVGATLALPRTGAARRWLRLLPILGGLLQLLILAPALDFGPLAWTYYLVLSAAALWLGWREAALVPGAAAALSLVLVLLLAALAQGDRATAPWAGIAITLLFGSAGHLLARRSPLWVGVALGATAGPVIIALALAHPLLPPVGWAALLTLAAIGCAAESWRDRDTAREAIVPSAGLLGGAGLAALLFGLAEAELLAAPWRWSAWLALSVALAGWSRRTRDTALAFLVVAPLAVTAAAMALGYERLAAYGASIVTDAAAPPLADLAAIGLLPALLSAAAASLLLPGIPRLILGWTGYGLALAFVPALLSAPWHSAGLGLATAATILLQPGRRAAAIAAGMATVAFMAPLLAKLLVLTGGSILGNRLPYTDLPPLLDILRGLSLPGALVGAALLRRRGNGRWMTQARFAIAAIALVTLYAVAKAPLAIASLERFETLGPLERVAITQCCFAGAWALAGRWPGMGRALLALALARYVWFDLIVLDPVLVHQSVGSLPLMNLATLDSAAAAVWLWRWRGDRRLYIAMLALTVIAVGATVRQATHGAILTGAIGRTENWLYSAALLGLALVWLGQGIRAEKHDLRIAGLVLLTAATLKVFLIDAAALEGILRILSFLGLGLALIGIGWAYGRVMPGQKPAA